ncbi:MAG: metallophosphoesterase [Phycisphaerae bacterium]|nr:metallophosphoesterase [Phycisphaerae bacterium]
MDLWKPRRNVFVTADTHFGDAVAFQKFARPFASVDAMDGALVAAINECVGKRDVLLHIGDFGGDHTWTTLERARLRAVRDGIACASIVLVRGNVDPVGARWFDRMFEETHDVLTWKGWPGASTAKPLRVVASHYPLRQWQGWPSGALHLYGHVHGTLAEEGRSTDIGVDCWSYRPVDLTSVLNMLAARPFQVPTVWPIRQPSRELE